MGAVLVIMAAGMGSRFGGLKQAQAISPDGRCILDFSVYDAKKAGFDKVVFIIRENMKKEFRKLVGERVEKEIAVEYAMQETDLLPEERKKPFGTAHAVLCCKEIVKTPFAVINADDYYGRDAFFDIYRHLENAERGEYAMTAYRLENTLSENGSVSRGLCEVQDGYLTKITEYTKIHTNMKSESDGEIIQLDADTPVSMNLWGFTPDIFEELEAGFDKFCKTADLIKDEFFIPSVVQHMIAQNKASVKVYKSAAQWYGITYKEDLERIKDKIEEYIKDGLYE